MSPRITGWDPMVAEWWPVIAEGLALPWARESVLMDLRWWAARARVDGMTRPGRPTLAKRWGWTDYAVKDALRSENEWGDDRFSPAERQPSASRAPAERQRENVETSVLVDEPPAERQPSASAPPEDRPTRVGSQTTDHRPQDTGETETRAPEVAPSPKPKRSASVAPEVAAVWSVYREEQAAIGSKRGESPPKGWGVAARVADPTIGADGMIAVIRWAHRSPHDRAKHLRDGGYLGDTLFRESKAPEYLPLALAWRDGTGPQPKPTGPGVLFGGSTFASKAEPAPTFPPPCRRWSNVLARLRLDGDAELVAAWLADSDLLDDRTVGVRTAHHVDWLTTAGGGLDPATEDMTAAIADALDVPRHRLRFVERPRVALEVPA